MRRQAAEYDPAVAGSDPLSKPHVESRHWHLHRNGRFDVVGRSPVDAASQSARVRQWSPYGRPIAEGFVDPSSGAALPVGNALTPGHVDDQPSSIFSRRRIWERGLTGKP